MQTVSHNARLSPPRPRRRSILRKSAPPAPSLPAPPPVATDADIVEETAYQGRRAIEALYLGAEFLSLESSGEEAAKKLAALRTEMVNALAALRELEDAALRRGEG